MYGQGPVRFLKLAGTEIVADKHEFVVPRGGCDAIHGSRSWTLPFVVLTKASSVGFELVTVPRISLFFFFSFLPQLLTRGPGVVAW